MPYLRVKDTVHISAISPDSLREGQVVYCNEAQAQEFMRSGQMEETDEPGVDSELVTTREMRKAEPVANKMEPAPSNKSGPAPITNPAASDVRVTGTTTQDAKKGTKPIA
jgi:hypothetical protein